MALPRPPEQDDRVRHSGQTWPDAVRYGAGTVVKRVRLGRWNGANVLVDADPARGVPRAYLAFYTDDQMFFATEGGEHDD